MRAHNGYLRISKITKQYVRLAGGSEDAVLCETMHKSLCMF